jgi:putative transposase
MPQKDARIKQKIKETIGTSRKGRRKVIAMLRRENPQLSPYRIRRVYERYGFSLNRKYRRRMKQIPANPIEIPLKANQEWGIDFMSDSMVDGRKIRTLNIIDHYDRACKGIVASRSFPAQRVTRELDKVIEKCGKPRGIRTDNGPEFRSKHFQKWLRDNEIAWVRIQKGKPQQNAIIERFNRTFREDILDAEILKSIEHAQSLTNEWVHSYNTQRPHESLNDQTPCEYAA